MAGLLVLPRPAKSVQNGAGFSGKVLKRKEWPRYHRENSYQVRGSRLCQEEKKQSRLSRVPDHEGGRESSGGRKPHPGE